MHKKLLGQKKNALKQAFLEKIREDWVLKQMESY